MERYTEHKLRLMSDVQIQQIAKTLGIRVQNNSIINTLIKNILEKQNPPKNTSLSFGNNAPKQPEEQFDPLSNITSEKQIKSIVQASINQFTIQINKANLLDYFGSALIYPVNYEIRELARSQRTKDIQHFSPNHLLISDGFTDEPNEQQVLIEVSLTDFDKQNLDKLHETVYLLPYPLPISRVNKIYFANKESQENSIASANTFQDAFLPIHLFDIWTETIENRTNIVREIQASQISANKNLKTDSQDKFNRILGMLAFMKNAELYYANETHELATYSDNYFKLLKVINPFFDKPEIGALDKGNLSFYETLITSKNNSNKTLLKIVNAIYDNDTFRKDIVKQLLGTPTEEVQYAFSLLVRDKTLEALQAIDQLKEPELALILLAFLFRFRDKEGSDKYALKEQISYLINRKVLKAPKTFNRASIVLAVLGLYYGYRSLPKDEEIKLNDSFFASFSENGKFNIKYKLNNLLDRITIESVYQYCFGDNQKNDFDFLKDDKTFVKYDLTEGYSDEKTFSIVEGHSIVRITKLHNQQQQEVKQKTKNWFEKLHIFISSLFKKKEIANIDMISELSKFVNIHEDGYFAAGSKIIELVENYTAYSKLYDFLDKNHLLSAKDKLPAIRSSEFDIWLHSNPTFELEKLLSEFQTL